MGDMGKRDRDMGKRDASRTIWTSNPILRVSREDPWGQAPASIPLLGVAVPVGRSG